LSYFDKFAEDLGRKPVSGRFDANFHAYPYVFLCAQCMAEAFFAVVKAA
jgi:hypothetical protein